MKKSLLISAFIIVSIFSTSVFAQSGRFFIGANAGIGVSKVSTLLDYGIAYNGNVSIQYKLSDNFSLVSGIGFEQRNSKDEIHAIDEQYNSYNFLMRHYYNFVQVPVLFRAEIGNKTKYFINAGPYFSYITNQNTMLLDENTQIISEYSLTDGFNKFVTGVSFGAGVNIPIADKINLSCELRENLDLSNITKTEGATAKTNSSLLFLGINYCLGD